MIHKHVIRHFVKVSVLLFVLAVIPFFTVLAQTPDSTYSDIDQWVKNKYLLRGTGIVNINYRDMATSPLTYRGLGFSTFSGSIDQTGQKEFCFLTDLSIGATLTFSPLSDYFPSPSSSVYFGLTLYSHLLYNIPQLSTNIFNTKMGGALVSTTNMRQNSQLQNNSAGFESLLNLMFSGKTTADVSRRKTIVRDFIFFERTYKPVKREVSFMMNIGLLNLNYRPGYAYISETRLDGSETNLLNYFLNSHSWRINGWRLQSELGYTVYRPSGNARRWSYVWDAANVPGGFEKFQMATHSIKFTYLINKN